ncbi:MAG: PTS sugar transporter subunit IIC [Clostridiales Family XIII bacterium]|jgi:PTS system galactitol-specific IIC component|nr:PTS sugar transporter subunit IIC [Clostridiales Family XIII bacterium]
MQTVIDLFHYIQEGIDAAAVAIALIAILGVCFGIPAGKALRGAFAAGAGFAGLALMTDLLGGTLVPAVRTIAENSGLSLEFIDLGEPPFAAIVSASEIGAWILPLGIAVNLLMLATNTTRTIDIDLLHYRYFAYTGAMVQIASDSYALGLAAAAINMAVVLIIADRAAPRLEQYAGLRGVSLPHGFAAAFVPVAFVANRIVEYLPGLNRPKADMDRIQKRLGACGEPAFIGLALGFAVALAAGLGAASVSELISDSLSAAVRMSAVFALTPKIVAFLMEGIRPLADAAGARFRKRSKKRGAVCIGVDAACGLGHPLVLTCTPILTLLSVFLAVILPGNRMLPFDGLALIPCVLVAVLPVTGGAFFRSLLVGALTIAVMLYCGSGAAELFMRAAEGAAAETYANYAGSFTSLRAANPLSLIASALGRLHGVGIAIMAVIAVFLAVENRGLIAAEAKKSAEKPCAGEEEERP